MTSESIRRRVGNNTKRLRTGRGMTLDELGRTMKSLGFPWSAGRVSDLEAGKKAVSIPEVIALLFCLSTPTERLRLEDLFDGEAPLELSQSWNVSTEHFLELLQGHRVSNDQRDYPVWRERWERDSKVVTEALKQGAQATSALNRYAPKMDSEAYFTAYRRRGHADDKAAKTLDVSSEELVAASLGLWGKTFTEHRDALSVGKSAQSKGHVSRQLLDELRDYLGANRGDD